jgi:hypothetical protein
MIDTFTLVRSGDQKSMCNFAFTNVYSRIKSRGNWFGLGAVYTF